MADARGPVVVGLDEGRSGEPAGAFFAALARREPFTEWAALPASEAFELFFDEDVSEEEGTAQDERRSSA